MKFIENTKINFMALKNAGFTISGIMATGSIILLLMGINLGIDFKGGTMIGLNFSEEVNIEEIRNVMKAIPSDSQVVDLSTEEIKHFGSTDDVMIKVKARDNVSPDFAQDIVNHIYQTMGDKAPEDKNNFILSLDTVSPKVGTELSGKAFWSILSSLALILLYISIRFEFKFAIGAILALIHDITITLGIFSLTGYEITLSTVAAFLTIVGYSLNDTIVILDRIRENMRSSGTVLLDATINKSINQSLSRTLITSLTTLLVITVLLMYGGVTIRPFAFTLLVGVIIGTYSSIYIASTFLSTLYKSN
ncbi:MAG: protein translocase subunit SecF [Candidatus Neomarinimicrobiota bacterium]|nr:protein translocase subunit SecF [Candidatus Neomarinimicrobiota bacterium]